jgi:apolipoprotein D and lipocalin family protein
MKALKKIGVAALFAASMITPALAQQEVKAVDQLDLNKYLGQWHEVARKPLTFQKDCAYNVTANYSLNAKGNVNVDNRCYKANGSMKQSMAEAYVQNAPANSKLKVSFLPKAIRWIPVARGDYWVLKIDQDYQTALVGEPNKKYLWVLSREPQPNKAIVQEYLNYAQSIGYDLSDVIYTPYKAK